MDAQHNRTQLARQLRADSVRISGEAGSATRIDAESIAGTTRQLTTTGAGAR